MSEEEKEVDLALVFRRLHALEFDQYGVALDKENCIPAQARGTIDRFRLAIIGLCGGGSSRSRS